MDPDTRYRGRIIAGSHLFTSGTGTAGYKIMIGFGENEETEYVIWMTDKNRNRAIETFGKLGVQPNDIRDEASVVALSKGETFKDVYTVKVSWIDTDTGPIVEASPSLMVAFFHGSEPAGTAFADDPRVGRPITDDDIPF